MGSAIKGLIQSTMVNQLNDYQPNIKLIGLYKWKECRTWVLETKSKFKSHNNDFQKKNVSSWTSAHQSDQLGQIHCKNIAAFTARFLKCLAIFGPLCIKRLEIGVKESILKWSNPPNTRRMCEMFKVYNKNTRMTSMTSLWCFYC